MPESKQTTFEAFTKLTPARRKAALKESIEKAIGQLANAQVMHDFYRARALEVADPKEAGKCNMQADQVLQAQQVNFDFMEWAEKQK